MTDDKYSQEQLTKAQEELKNMSPEALLGFRDYIAALEEAAKLGEAGGIAFTELETPRGAVINVTARSLTPQGAIESLLSAIKAVKDKYDITPRYKVSKEPLPPFVAPMSATTLPSSFEGQAGQAAQAAQALVKTTPPPQAQSGGETISVDSIEKMFTKNNVPYLRARGGKWHKYGVAAYPEVIPAGFDINALNMNTQYPAPPEMKWAVCSSDPDGKNLKVIAFHA